MKARGVRYRGSAIPGGAGGCWRLWSRAGSSRAVNVAPAQNRTGRNASATSVAASTCLFCGPDTPGAGDTGYQVSGFPPEVKAKR